MPIRLTSSFWPGCQYRVHYAESGHSIYSQQGWAKHRHKFWTIDVAPIPLAVQVKERIIQREAHSVALYAPGTSYLEKLEVGRLMSSAWILFEEVGTPSQLHRLVGTEGYLFLPDRGRLVHESIVGLIEAARSSAPGRGHFASSHLHRILGIVYTLKAEAVSGNKTRSRARKVWIHPWHKILWETLDQNQGKATLEILAKKTGVSLSTLTHCYRKFCGQSFTESVRNWRLEKISKLLAHSKASAKEIAFETGFTHPGHLSAFFKSATGCTPSAYRDLIKF